MAKETQVIKDEIEGFRIANSGEYVDYYIGITNDIDRRLIENSEILHEHLRNGEYTNGNPTYSEECISREEAVEIERHFQRRGMLKFNARSVGTEDSRFIYCYKMTEDNKRIILEKNNLNKMKHLIDFNAFK